MPNANPDVRLILLPENLYEYLTFVLQSYYKAGVEPDELGVGNELWRRVKASPKIDFSQLGKVKMESLDPQSVAITIEPEPGQPGQGPIIADQS